MKKLALLAFAFCLLASPAMAISEFSKHWKEQYLGDGASDEFKSAGRKAGCYVCHVKGEDKKEVRNEYGAALQKFLKAEDYPRERIQASPEEVKKEILEGFKKANALKSKDGKVFEAKIKAGELPATDAGL